MTRVIYELSDAGHYTLPDDLCRWRAGVDDLRARLRDAQNRASAADPGGVQSRIVNALPDWAAKGEVPADWVSDVLEAQTTQARAMAEANGLDDAVSKAESRLVRMTVDAADEILVEHLRPVLARVVEAVRKATKGVSVPWDSPSQLARSNTAVRTAWAAVEDANVTYEALRRCQTQLQMLTADAEPDAFGSYHELRNINEVWNNRAWSQSTPPWPSNPLARLVWVCTEPRVVWLPTGSEVMEVWLAEQGKKGNQPRVAVLPGY